MFRYTSIYKHPCNKNYTTVNTMFGSSYLTFVHGEVYSIQPWFSPGTPVSSTNKSDRHDILVN